MNMSLCDGERIKVTFVTTRKDRSDVVHIGVVAGVYKHHFCYKHYVRGTCLTNSLQFKEIDDKHMIVRRV